MASDKLWNWIDVHPEFGIGRPYLGRSAHVAPIDGREYADHRKPNIASRLLAKVSHTLLHRRTATSDAATAAEVRVNSPELDRSLNFFGWERLPPAAFSVLHIPAAFFLDAKGPTTAR